MTPSCGFTVQHYREIVTGFIDRGYRFCSFRNYYPHAKSQIILRHDIDISLEDALRIAQVDASLGIGASYHFLLTAETYNLCSTNGQKMLAEIRALGQHVGLHIDPSALTHHGNGETIVALQELFDLATTVIGHLDAFSLHRPATYGELDNLNAGIPGIELAPSADVLRKHMIYRSDSRRQWWQGCICQELDTFKHEPVQLLLHPIWWTEEPQTRDEILKRQLSHHQQRMDTYLSGNLSFYKTV